MKRVLIVTLVVTLLMGFAFAVPVLAQGPTVAFEEGLFVSLLIKLLNSGAAGMVVFWLLEQPFAKDLVTWLERTSKLFTFSASELKRYVAIVLSTILSLGIYMLLVLVNVSPVPVGAVAWADLLLWLGGLSFGVSQVVHARKKLNKEHVDAEEAAKRFKAHFLDESEELLRKQ